MYGCDCTFDPYNAEQGYILIMEIVWIHISWLHRSQLIWVHAVFYYSLKIHGCYGSPVGELIRLNWGGV